MISSVNMFGIVSSPANRFMLKQVIARLLNVNAKLEDNDFIIKIDFHRIDSYRTSRFLSFLILMYNYIKMCRSGWKACMFVHSQTLFCIVLTILNKNRLNLYFFFLKNPLFLSSLHLLESAAGWYVGHCSWVGSWWKLIIEALQPQGTAAVRPPLECNCSLWS